MLTRSGEFERRLSAPMEFPDFFVRQSNLEIEEKVGQ
jgi:hypothetical protein